VQKSEEARQLVRVLDEVLHRAEGDSANLTRQQKQDLHDGERADRILAEMRRTRESYSVADLREEFGLSK